MFEKQKLTQIQRYTTNKDGSPLTFQKDGKSVPYTRVLLKTDREGDKMMSGFGNKTNEHWKVGDEIEIKCTEVRGKDGKTYFNFEMPKKDDAVIAKLNALDSELTRINLNLNKIIRHLSDIEPLNTTSDGSLMPNFDPKEIEYPDADQDAIAEFMKE